MRASSYSVLAGNHDIDASRDDTRGPSPYLDTFPPERFRRMATYGGSTANGYNSYHVFRAAGRQWLLLAMDWRPSDASFAWARDVIAKHPRLPVVLTTHELVNADHGNPVAYFTDHGNRVWDQLVKHSDQIFLTLNGPFWPPGRVVRQNAAGHDVHLHLTNYQDRYYGGSGSTTSTWPGTRSTSRPSRRGSSTRTRHDATSSPRVTSS
ncbi:hypothetical protein ACXC9Q_35300 [Kribbella sp. CWNU-51]